MTEAAPQARKDERVLECFFITIRSRVARDRKIVVTLYFNFKATFIELFWNLVRLKTRPCSLYCFLEVFCHFNR